MDPLDLNIFDSDEEMNENAAVRRQPKVFKNRCFQICILLLLVDLSLGQTTLPNITVLASIDGHHKTFYCVIKNDDSAITWITPYLNENPLSYNINDISDISCDMKPKRICSKFWTKGEWRLENSLNFVSGPILDRRWERFEVINTGDEFEVITDRLQLSNFEIPFSIRIKKDAFIYLCDGKYPPKANCYWFILGGWEGLVSVIRKCKKTEIPESSAKYPDSPCKDALDTKSDTESRVNISEWTHFIIHGNQGTYSLRKLGEHDPFLTYSDRTGSAFQPDHLIIKSRNGEGIWKFHLFDFLFTTQEKQIQLGPTFRVLNGTSCVALFVRMCKNCRLTLTLKDSSNNTFHQNIEWTEVKFSVKNLRDDKYSLWVSTKSNDPNRFWALDDVNRCTENDIRIAEIEFEGDGVPDYMCYSLRHPKFKINLEDLKHVNVSDSTCPENTFGKSCIACNEVLSEDYCKAHAVCDTTADATTKCTCSAGYAGPTCETNCQGNFYGFGCKNKCGKCQGDKKCDFITGKCQNCIEGYTGNTCKIPLYPILKYPPLINVSHTSMVIQLETNEYDGQSPPSYYRIYYKANEQMQWQRTDEYKIVDLSPKVINLTSNTNYKVRVLLRAQEDDYKKEFATELEVTTTCSDLTERDIEIRPTNVSAEIIIQTSPETCPLRYFRVITNIGQFTLNSTNFYVNSLMPYAPYNISFICLQSRNTFAVPFTTLEGRPTTVQNLEVSDKTSTSVNIRWKPPKQANGILRLYKISYKHQKYLGCKNDVKDERFFGSATTSNGMFTISGLIPYSEYQVHVEGVTIIDGDPTYITITTLQEGFLKDEELPSLTLNQSVGFTRIILIQQKCEQRRGSLTYHATLCCLKIRCSCMTKNLTTTDEPSVSIDFEVSVYSNYNLEVELQRTNGNYLDRKLQQDFISLPSEPHQVRNLTIYTKTKNSASLRWLPPYPPTGVIEEYLIVYSCVHYWYVKQVKQIVNGDPCKLWPEFLCVTINIERFENCIFQFDVHARNEMPETYGPSNTVEGKLEVEKPESPKNLTATWDDHHNLTLTWVHPDVTNGPLTGFVVKIEGIPPYTVKAEDQLLYNYTITNAPPASKLSVAVAAKNEAGEAPLISIETYSPPKTPNFSTDPYVQEVNNHTLFVTISPPKDIYNDSILYVIVTELNTKRPSEVSEIPKRIEEAANVDINYFSWIAEEISLGIYENSPRKVIIGSNEVQYSERLELNLQNKALKMGTNYTVTFVLSNVYMNKSRWTVKKIQCITASTYEEEERTAGLNEKENGTNYSIFLILLVVPLLCFFVCFILGRKCNIPINISLRPLMENFGGRSSSHAVRLVEIEQDLSRLQSPTLQTKSLLNISQNELDQSIELDQLYEIPNEFDQFYEIPNELDPMYEIPNGVAGDALSSNVVKLNDFESYVKEAIENGELERQHAKFHRGQTRPWEQGTKPCNKTKNRYNNLAAYDHTRVKLEMINGNATTDYINANYIDGYNNERAYIATQTPLATTVEDFWRMIWQERVEYIIMLTNTSENGKKNVMKYWPDANQTLEFGPVQIHYVSVTVLAHYESRIFTITCEGQERNIEQLHFMSWPDHGVPLYAHTLVPFLRKILTIPHGKSPIVVHCSTGCAHTGTIILCDICLRMAASDGEINVLYHQHKIREQRVNMVYNAEQYKLVHLVLIQCLVAPETKLICAEHIQDAIENILAGDTVDLQMKYLDDTAWQDQVMKQYVTDETGTVYSHKNRFKDIVPDETSRVLITPYPAVDEPSSYINAVKVDGFQALAKYIVTQQPLPDTLGDFWRLVYEKDISVIISLNSIDPTDDTCCQFWPTETSKVMEPVSYLKVTYSDTNDADYDVISVDLINTDTKNSEKRVLKIINFKNWSYVQYHPKNYTQILTVIDEVNRLGKTSNCILVTCHDGARASGLFVALTFVIDKIKLEQECDVCLAVRSIRCSRKQFVRNREQFAFLYEAAMDYVNNFKAYSNFVPHKK